MIYEFLFKGPCATTSTIITKYQISGQDASGEDDFPPTDADYVCSEESFSSEIESQKPMKKASNDNIEGISPLRRINMKKYASNDNIERVLTWLDRKPTKSDSRDGTERPTNNNETYLETYLSSSFYHSESYYFRFRFRF